MSFLSLTTRPSLNHGLAFSQSIQPGNPSSQRCCWPLLNSSQSSFFPPSTRSVSFPINLNWLSISPFPLLATPPPSLSIESTQDLISRFHLLTAYDKFVRPFISQEHDPHANHLPTTPAPAVAPSADKGKGKERDPGTPTIASAATPGTHDPDDDEGRDGKKKKNTYRHLIRGIPGA